MKIIEIARDYMWSLLPPYHFRAGFHGDVVYQTLVDTIIDELNVTAFVETGTYLGHSTAYVAKKHRAVPVLSCEIYDHHLARARRRLWRLRNVDLYKGSSEGFIRDLLSDDRIGRLPLFFLDAHWYDYWPLEDEVRQISSSGRSAVIVIDDFQVPNRPEFDFDIGGGNVGLAQNTGQDQKICGLELIRPQLSTASDYNALFPAYKFSDAFPQANSRSLRSEMVLRGHIVLCQNLENQFQKLKNTDFVGRYYEDYRLGICGAKGA